MRIGLYIGNMTEYSYKLIPTPTVASPGDVSMFVLLQGGGFQNGGKGDQSQRPLVIMDMGRHGFNSNCSLGSTF